MQTSQIKTKLVEMLQVATALERVELELKAILGPINQFSVQEPVVKAKPHKINGGRREFKSNEFRNNIRKIWYYSKQNSVAFSPGEIIQLLNITKGQLVTFWTKMRGVIQVEFMLDRQPNLWDGNKKTYRYKFSGEAAQKIQEYIQ